MVLVVVVVVSVLFIYFCYYYYVYCCVFLLLLRCLFFLYNFVTPNPKTDTLLYIHLFIFILFALNTFFIIVSLPLFVATVAGVLCVLFGWEMQVSVLAPVTSLFSDKAVAAAVAATTPGICFL